MSPAPDRQDTVDPHDLANVVEQLVKGFEALGHELTQQRLAINSLAEQPRILPTGEAPGAITPFAPPAAIQPATPNLSTAPAYPLTPVWPPTGPLGQPSLPPPLVRRDIERVALHAPNRPNEYVTTREVTTSLDLETLTETSDVTMHHHRNRYGEPIDLNQPASACYQCGDLLSDPPRRCKVCQVPLCRGHAWTLTTQEPNDPTAEHTDFLCEQHAQPQPKTFSEWLVRTLFN